MFTTTLFLVGLLCLSQETHGQTEGLPYKYELPDNSSDSQYITDVIKTTDIGDFKGLLKALHDPGSQTPGCEDGQRTTASVDPTNPACFFIYFCSKPGSSVRGCCGVGKNFTAPTSANPLGTCEAPVTV